MDLDIKLQISLFNEDKNAYWIALGNLGFKKVSFFEFAIEKIKGWCGLGDRSSYDAIEFEAIYLLEMGQNEKLFKSVDEKKLVETLIKRIGLFNTKDSHSELNNLAEKIYNSQSTEFLFLTQFINLHSSKKTLKPLLKTKNFSVLSSKTHIPALKSTDLNRKSKNDSIHKVVKLNVSSRLENTPKIIHLERDSITVPPIAEHKISELPKEDNEGVLANIKKQNNQVRKVYKLATFLLGLISASLLTQNINLFGSQSLSGQGTSVVNNPSYKALMLGSASGTSAQANQLQSVKQALPVSKSHEKTRNSSVTQDYFIQSEENADLKNDQNNSSENFVSNTLNIIKDQIILVASSVFVITLGIFYKSRAANKDEEANKSQNPVQYKGSVVQGPIVQKESVTNDSKEEQPITVEFSCDQTHGNQSSINEEQSVDRKESDTLNKKDNKKTDDSKEEQSATVQVSDDQTHGNQSSINEEQSVDRKESDTLNKKHNIKEEFDKDNKDESGNSKGQSDKKLVNEPSSNEGQPVEHKDFDTTYKHGKTDNMDNIEESFDQKLSQFEKEEVLSGQEMSNTQSILTIEDELLEDVKNYFSTQNQNLDEKNILGDDDDWTLLQKSSIESSLNLRTDLNLPLTDLNDRLKQQILTLKKGKFLEKKVKLLMEISHELSSKVLHIENSLIISDNDRTVYISSSAAHSWLQESLEIDFFERVLNLTKDNTKTQEKLKNFLEVKKSHQLIIEDYIFNPENLFTNPIKTFLDFKDGVPIYECLPIDSTLYDSNTNKLGVKSLEIITTQIFISPRGKFEEEFKPIRLIRNQLFKAGFSLIRRHEISTQAFELIRENQYADAYEFLTSTIGEKKLLAEESACIKRITENFNSLFNFLLDEEKISNVTFDTFLLKFPSPSKYTKEEWNALSEHLLPDENPQTNETVKDIILKKPVEEISWVKIFDSLIEKKDRRKVTQEKSLI